VKEALARVPGLQGVLSLGAAVLLQPGLLGLQSALNSELFLRAASIARHAATAAMYWRGRADVVL